MKVLVIGDACVDLVALVPKENTPQAEHPRPTLHCGGTGANTAVAIARLGVPTSLMAVVGRDGYGSLILRNLKEEHVDTRFVYTDDMAFTSSVLAMIGLDGQRYAYLVPRGDASDAQLTPDHVLAKSFEGVAWVHTTGMCLDRSPSREAVLFGMQRAHEADIPVSLDLNLRNGLTDGVLRTGFRDTLLEAIKLATVVLGSADEEFRYLVHGDTAEALARALATRNRTVVARLGAQGVLAVAGGKVVEVPAYTVDVVDTLGAGDVFNGGFIAAMIEGRSLAESLRWGNAAAALKITRPGARGAPTREELLDFLAVRSATTERGGV